MPSSTAEEREQHLKEIQAKVGLRLLTLEESASLLLVNRQTLFTDIQSGELPAYFMGKSYLIKEADLSGYLERFRFSPPVQASQPEEEVQPPKEEEAKPQPLLDTLVLLTIEEMMIFLRRGRPAIMIDAKEGRLTLYKPKKEFLVKREELLRYLETFKFIPKTGPEE
jgi:excisionase family DNA binding protein